MNFLYKLRLSSVQRRLFSSIPNPVSKAPLTSKEECRAALALLKSEKKYPRRIRKVFSDAFSLRTYSSEYDQMYKAMSQLSSCNYFEGTRSFIEELKNSPDLKTEWLISHAIVLYGEAGMLDDAVKVFDEMRDLGVERTVASLNALFFACILVKNYAEVKRIFLELPKKYSIEPNRDSYNYLIKAFCKSGSSSSAYSVLAEMERKRCEPNLETFLILIAGFYKEEKFDDVGKVLDMIPEMDTIVYGIHIYDTRIHSLCKLKRSVDAKALLDEMISRRMKPDVGTYSHLIHGFGKEGDIDEAKNLYKRMKYDDVERDGECYYTLVDVLCQAGDFEAALPVCKEAMFFRWCKIPTIKLLVNGLASIAKVDEARELVEKVMKVVPEPKRADLLSEFEKGIEENIPRTS